MTFYEQCENFKCGDAYVGIWSRYNCVRGVAAFPPTVHVYEEVLTDYVSSQAASFRHNAGQIAPVMHFCCKNMPGEEAFSEEKTSLLGCLDVFRLFLRSVASWRRGKKKGGVQKEVGGMSHDRISIRRQKLLHRR